MQSPRLGGGEGREALFSRRRNWAVGGDMALFGSLGKKLEIVSADDALPGRLARMPIPTTHVITGEPLEADFTGFGQIMVAMGCFWGVERKFWEAPGVISTSVGYVNGITPNPTYEEVCTGRTGHTEAVRAIFDLSVTNYEAMLTLFWENHDPTQGMRQGNDAGTQYRSGSTTTTISRRTSCLRPATRTRKNRRRRVSVRSRRRSARCPNTISPRNIISNILPKTRTATAA